jgi:hypothetical protein
VEDIESDRSKGATLKLDDPRKKTTAEARLTQNQFLLAARMVIVYPRALIFAAPARDPSALPGGTDR